MTSSPQSWSHWITLWNGCVTRNTVIYHKHFTLAAHFKSFLAGRHTTPQKIINHPRHNTWSITTPSLLWGCLVLSFTSLVSKSSLLAPPPINMYSFGSTHTHTYHLTLLFPTFLSPTEGNGCNKKRSNSVICLSVNWDFFLARRHWNYKAKYSFCYTVLAATLTKTKVIFLQLTLCDTRT